MTANLKTSKLIQTKYGYWTFDPLPSKEELNHFYADSYYQNEGVQYQLQYSDEEVAYFRLRTSLVMRQLRRLRPGQSLKTFFDVGCGEGWFLDKFYKDGMKVRGIDFSAFAIERFHPHMKEFFEQGNIYVLLDRYIKSGEKYDVILLANVIEHVQDPIGLLNKLRKILIRDGILVILAPNDFSSIHEHLLATKIIDKPFWVRYPGHLSYFNKQSMLNIFEGIKLKTEAIVSDYPIELNLFNPNSNYSRDPKTGKGVHLLRVRTNNFLAGIDEESLLDLYTVYGRMGVGRNLYYYCSLIN